MLKPFGPRLKLTSHVRLATCYNLLRGQRQPGHCTAGGIKPVCGKEAAQCLERDRTSANKQCHYHCQHETSLDKGKDLPRQCAGCWQSTGAAAYDASREALAAAGCQWCAHTRSGSTAWRSLRWLPAGQTGQPCRSGWPPQQLEMLQHRRHGPGCRRHCPIQAIA